jgi:hypothetical protein
MIAPASVNDTLTLITRVRGLSKKATHIEYEEALQAGQATIIDLNGQLGLVKDEKNKLTEKLRRQRSFFAEKGVMWRKLDKEKEQPFCPVCYAKDLDIPLQPVRGWRAAKNTEWSCPNPDCQADFNPWDYEEPDRNYSSGDVSWMW